MAQERLGERSGLSGKFIGEVERGEKSISIDSLYRVAEALAVPLGHLTDIRPGRRAVVPTQDAKRIVALVSGGIGAAMSIEPIRRSERYSGADSGRRAAQSHARGPQGEAGRPMTGDTSWPCERRGKLRWLLLERRPDPIAIVVGCSPLVGVIKDVLAGLAGAVPD